MTKVNPLKWYKAFYTVNQKKIYFSVCGESMYDCADWVRSTVGFGFAVFADSAKPTVVTH